MRIIDVGPISNNPQTSYKLVFGQDVSASKILDSLKKIAEMRERLGVTTVENTIQTVKEAEAKLQALDIQ
jgi:hypothetical protein